MKRLLAVLSALLLALTACAGALAGEVPEKTGAEHCPEADAFCSFWVSGDGLVRIRIIKNDGVFEVLAVEMTGENTFNLWKYLPVYDEETKCLVADGNGMMSENEFNGSGDITAAGTLYEDGSASFRIDGADELYWSDEADPTFEATVFHRIGLFPGRYLSGRAQLEIRWAGEDLIYDVNMDWPENVSQSWSWALSGNYDPGTDTLPVEGYRLLYTYQDNGELDLDADLQEAEAHAVFAFDSAHALTCASPDDESLNGLRFEADPDSSPMWMWQF